MRPGAPGGAHVHPLPQGFGLQLDPATRRCDGGSTLIGGSPLTVLRLSADGSALVDGWEAGAAVPAGHAANRLARRLLDLGLAHPRPPVHAPRPGVTVVIPVRDDAAGLAATLAHLGPAESVLVVDDGSQDGAAVEAVCASSRLPGRRVAALRLERPRGPGGARQVGWQAASTDVVAFVDAGCEPEPGWLDGLLPHLADPAVAAAAPRIRARAAAGAPSWLVAYEELRSPLDLGPAASAARPRSRVPYVPTAVLVVRRSALAAVGGFDPALRVGEDVDLVWRLADAGWFVRYEPAVTAGHPVRSSLGGLLRQRFGYGRSAALLAERHGQAAAPLVISAWSAVAWALAGVGHPLAGAGVAGATTAALVPQLRGLGQPVVEALRLGGAGHLRAGRLVADACRRSWWPLVLLACFCSRRARRVAVAAAIVPPLLEGRPAADRLGTARWLALRLLDDLAYGAGVWAGAALARSTAALRPCLAGGRPRIRPRPAAGLVTGRLHSRPSP